MAGFVYIMSNPAFPDLIKIGKSTRDPTVERVKELNQTGVPEKFKVEYYAFVEDEDYLERAVHTRFDQHRPNKSREFFKVECLEAIEAIRNLSLIRAQIKYEEVFYVSQERLAEIRRAQDERDRIQAEYLEEEKAERLAQEAKDAAARVEREKLDEAQRTERQRLDEGLQAEQAKGTTAVWVILGFCVWILLVMNSCS